MKISLYFSQLLISIGLFLSACAAGVPTEKIDFTYAFCDGNSKVWMLHKVKLGESTIQDFQKLDGEFLIFYLSGKVVQGKLQDLARGKGKIGAYTLDNENGYVTLQFPNEKWDFSFQFSFEDKLELYPTTESDLKYSLELIPFPEL